MFLHPAFAVDIWPPLVLAAALILAFEIWMIIDAATNNHLSGTAKAWWIVGMLILHPFVAIAYFFIARTKRIR